MPPRHIVITGVSKGLGRTMALWFASHGHRVTGCGRDPAALSRLGLRLPDAGGFQPVDIANDHAVATWAGRVLEQQGPPDLLINNAAVIAGNAPLWRVPLAEINAVLHTNIRGTISVVRHFLPAMIDSGTGVVANFSSGWGRGTSPHVAVYCASKFAVEGLTAALAQELPEGLAAVAVNPGIICTDMLRSCFGPEAGSYPEPDAWAEKACPFLLGLGPAQNGQSLDVPGVPVT